MMSLRTNTLLEQKPRHFDWHPAAIWRWLTEPADEIIEPEIRRRSRLLLTVVVLIIAVSLPGVVASQVLTTSALSLFENPVFYASLGSNVIFIFSYLLGRTKKYYTLGAITALATISSTAIVATAFSPQDAKTLLLYLVVAVLLGSLLLPLRGVIALAVFNSFAVALLPVLVPDLAMSSVANVLIFVLVMSVIITVSASIRQQDLHRIERQASELAEAVQRAEEANRLKSQFLATMSHELRTPLNAIIGFAEVMMMGLAGEIPSQALHTTSRIHHNSERLLKLIDDLLDISKIEAGRVELVRRPFEPAELLADVERTVKPQAVEKGLNFTTKLDPALPHSLVGDAQRLQQIMLNLASNAIKFTDQGSVNVSLLLVGSDEWSIEVADTGVGIPAHAQEYIFEKFRQVDGTSRRAYRGAGLGLAIVKELALLMDGEVKVRSKPGAGSTFTVTLPMVIPEGTLVR